MRAQTRSYPARRNVRRLSAGVAAAAAVLSFTAGPASAAAPSKPGVVRGGNLWLLRSTPTAGPATTTFSYGSTTDTIHVMGDWDGNGSKTPGVVRTAGSTLVWYLRNSYTAGAADIKPFIFGGASDTPIVGDWDGNGKDTIGVVRRAPGATKLEWLLRNSNTAGDARIDFTYGRVTDVAAVVGDWDGNGTDTPGVVRHNGTTLQWLLSNRNFKSAAAIDLNYGASTDQPIVGDWDGNGVTGIGITRSDNGSRLWVLRNTLSTGPAQISFLYGSMSDAPVVWQ